jgi:hypothetical protein
MSAQYGKPLNIKSSSAVWSQDAFMQDASKAMLTKAETKRVNELLSDIGRTFQQIQGSTLRELEANPELQRDIETYDNRFVRANTRFMNPRKRTEGLIKFIQAKYTKEINKRKTLKGKEAQIKKLQAHLDFFSPRNKRSIELMFQLHVMMIKAKMILIRKLNQVSELDTFVKTRDGFRVTNDEGFVAVDSFGKNAVKLVDRLQFSYNNFSPDTVKGWDRVNKILINNSILYFMGTTMLDFKDFMVVEYMPGYDSLINYQAHKRKRGLIGENSWNQLGQKKPVGNYLPAPKKGTVEKHGKTFQRGDHVIPHTGPHAGERHIVSDSKKGHVTMVHANGGHKYDTMTVRAKHHHLSPAEKKRKSRRRYVYSGSQGRGSSYEAFGPKRFPASASASWPVWPTKRQSIEDPNVRRAMNCSVNSREVSLGLNCL